VHAQLLTLLLAGSPDLDPHAFVVAVDDPLIEATARLLQRGVEIRYEHASVPRECRDVFGTHTYAMDYRPTALDWINARLLCVGGRNPVTGDTLLEAWSFDPPRLVHTRSGGEIRADNRTSVVRLYEGDALGREGVQGIVRFPGHAAPTALVQFKDSRDLFTVDMSTGAMRLAASPGSSGAALIDSRLADDWPWFDVRTHVSLGHVVILRKGGCDIPDDPERTLLLLFDLDRDGVLDRAGGYREWEEARMSNPYCWED
jgi:hypothetical protein